MYEQHGLAAKATGETAIPQNGLAQLFFLAECVCCELFNKILYFKILGFKKHISKGSVSVFQPKSPLNCLEGDIVFFVGYPKYSIQRQHYSEAIE